VSPHPFHYFFNLVEHNNRHHYNLSEIHDPDLVEQNVAFLRDMKVPMFVKYIIVGFFTLTWKWFYYAPNTYKELKLAQMRRNGKVIPPRAEEPITFKSIFVNDFYSGFEFLAVVILPYFVIHFFLCPLPLLWVGEQLEGYTGVGMYKTALTNLFLAELLTNFHAFVAIVTNHAGNDMYRFRHPCRPFSGSFFLRQVLASADYSMGTDLVDFMHGWLNYQIEHHMWPNLSMRSYQKAAPILEDICVKYGVPYVKESVWIRLLKTVAIMVGSEDMRWFPESFELKLLEQDAEMEKRKVQ
jgi:fatty acid desaturase